MSLTSHVNTIYTISIMCKYKKVLLVIFISAYDLNYNFIICIYIRSKSHFLYVHMD